MRLIGKDSPKAFRVVQGQWFTEGASILVEDGL